MIFRYAAAWLLMMLLAVLNGAFREAFLRERFGELGAHQLSTLTLLLLLSAFVWILVRIKTPESSGQAWLVGFIWLAMTLAFEFGFGHFIAGKPWSELLKDYDMISGRIWVLIPAWVTVAPYLFYRIARH
jgi:hypothetical protein